MNTNQRSGAEELDEETEEPNEETQKDKVESLLNAIVDALESDPDCTGSFINEFGDYSIAIPLTGGQKTLDDYMEKQKLYQYLADIAETLIDQLGHDNKNRLACCFTGHRPKKIPWLADEDDYRARRLKDTLKSLIDNLSMRGVCRYIAGNAEGFDTIAAETVLESNKYLEVSKKWQGVDKDWKLAELEIAIPFEGHNSSNQRVLDVQSNASIAHVVSKKDNHTQAYMERNEYMVDHSDIVIGLIDGDVNNRKSGGTYKTIDYAMRQGKPIVVFTLDGLRMIGPASMEFLSCRLNTAMNLNWCELQ